MSHDRWLVSYADFITLLFAFFVVLYASSQMDKKKVVRVSQAIHGAFQELGVFAGSAEGSVVRVEAAPPGPGQINSLDSGLISDGSHNTGIGLGTGGVDIARLKQELEEALGDQIRKHEIQMHETPEGLVVSLPEVGFFDSGDSELLAEGNSRWLASRGSSTPKAFRSGSRVIPTMCPFYNLRFKSNYNHPLPAPPRWWRCW